MEEVEPERRHRDEIEPRHVRDAETEDDVAIDVLLREARVKGAERHVENVEHDVDKEEDPAPTHQARRQGRDLRAADDVRLRARGVRGLGQLPGGEGVEHDRGEQGGAHPPEHAAERVEERGVLVHRLGPLEDEQVPGHVPEDPEHHEDARERHDHLLPDGGAPKLECDVHFCCPRVRGVYQGASH